MKMLLTSHDVRTRNAQWHKAQVGTVYGFKEATISFVAPEGWWDSIEYGDMFTSIDMLKQIDSGWLMMVTGTAAIAIPELMDDPDIEQVYYSFDF